MTEHDAGKPAAGPKPHLLSRPVADIAGAIIDDHRWREKDLPPAADPYLETMLGLSTRDLTTRYRHERVPDVVRGALDNLPDWQGLTAWRIRHELENALAAADRAAGTAP
jgi:hypothetical protein